MGKLLYVVLGHKYSSSFLVVLLGASKIRSAQRGWEPWCGMVRHGPDAFLETLASMPTTNQ
jgi:hypothetical protein